MRLLVYDPTDCHPRSIEVDGPPVDTTLRQAVGGEIEDVPCFNSISYEGVVHRCVAFCKDREKDHGAPLNAWATALWHSALRRQGYERGLRREDGTVADRLVGNVVVVFEERGVSDRYHLGAIASDNSCIGAPFARDFSGNRSHCGGGAPIQQVAIRPSLRRP